MVGGGQDDAFQKYYLTLIATHFRSFTAPTWEVRCTNQVFPFLVDWEGPEAIEERKSPSASHTPLHASSQVTANISTEPEQGSEQEEQEQEGSSDDGSEDDYVVERKRAKGKVRTFYLVLHDVDTYKCSI